MSSEKKPSVFWNVAEVFLLSVGIGVGTCAVVAASGEDYARGLEHPWALYPALFTIGFSVTTACAFWSTAGCLYFKKHFKSYD